MSGSTFQRPGTRSVALACDLSPVPAAITSVNTFSSNQTTMSQSSTLVRDRARAGKGASLPLARYFYPVTSIVLLLLTFWGFSKFYLHGQAYPGRPIAPPIRTLVIAHGIAMSAWIILMIIQPFLILMRKHRVHMALGKFGAALAAIILVLGLMVGVRSAAVTPPEVVIATLTPKQFMAVPVVSVCVFALFVAAGVKYRKKPHIHRSMMLLATLAALAAAVSRIDVLNTYYAGTRLESLFGPFLSTLLFGVILVTVRSVLTGSLDRILAIGVAALGVISIGIMALGRTDAWVSFATMLTG